MSRIVLASGSPRRQELLNRIGITDFDIRVPQTDEHYPAGLTPAQIVEYISREKADAAAKLCTPEEIVITADTMVCLDDSVWASPRMRPTRCGCSPRCRAAATLSAPASPSVRETVY